MKPPPSDHCFICNRQIDFFERNDWDLTWSFSDILPRGAKRPAAFFWAHDECIQKVAHPSFGTHQA